MTVEVSAIDAALRCHRAGDYRQAAEYYARALDVAPSPEIHSNLGVVKRALGDMEGAIASYRRAIAMDASCFEAHNNLGNLLWKQGHLEDALECFQQAASLKPSMATTRCTLGLVRLERGDSAGAIAEFEATLRIAPKFAEAHDGLGRALQKSGEIVQAAAAYRRAIELKPEFAAAHVNLGNALTALHRFGEACESYRSALRIHPADGTARDNLLMAMQYDPRFDVEELFAAHCEFGNRMQSGAPMAAHPNRVEVSDRRLRIGYVSPDFRKHSVAFFIEPILAAHDRQVLETFCYAEVAQPDEVTARIRRHAEHWRSTVGLTDVAVCEIIRRDAIDILVDLAGHTAGNRLGVFACKPAPIQVSYLGYGNTTGLSSVDYWLSDGVADPPGESRRHTETLVRLKSGIVCYAPPAEAPEVSPPPSVGNGYLTFGSFNKRVKINVDVVRLWSQVLRRLPTSRLVLKDRAFSSPDTCELTRAQFANNGVAGDRLQLLPRSESMRDHLRRYSRIDVALDPFPYGGTTTTCEALWMGVPVLTVRGNCYVGRMTSSILTQLDLTGFIADSPEDFVRRAVALDGQTDCLADLRHELRSVCAASPLCDAAGYAAELEGVYHSMWRRWCAEQSPIHAAAN